MNKHYSYGQPLPSLKMLEGALPLPHPGPAEASAAPLPLVVYWSLAAALEGQAPELSRLLQLRLQGFAGQVAVVSEDSLPELLEAAPWLVHDWPGLWVLTPSQPPTGPLPAAEALSEQLQAWLQAAQPLSPERQLQAAAQSWQQLFRPLWHDLSACWAPALPPLEQRQALCQRLQDWPLGILAQQQQFAPCWQAFLQLAAQCFSSPQPAEQQRLLALQAWLQVSLALKLLSDPALQAQNPQPLLQRALSQLQSLSRHWPALLEAAGQFAPAVAAQVLASAPDFAESAMAQEAQLGLKQWQTHLQHWCVCHPPEQLAQASAVVKAAESLQALMCRRGPEARRAELSRLAHTTIEQHLYTVAQLLNAADLHDLLTQFPGPGLNLEQLPHWQHTLQALWQTLLQAHPSQQAPATSESPAGGHLPENRPAEWGAVNAEATGKGPLVLLIEDNPVWAEELEQGCQQVLESFCAHYPAQRLRHWRLQRVDNWQSASQFLPQASLVIADLAVPAQPGGLPDRALGVQFLAKQFKGYQRRFVPLLVHTTPSWWLQDQQELLQAGVSGLDFVFKTQPDQLWPRLRYWLESLRRQHQSPHKSLLEVSPGQRRLRLNGVELKLSPQQHDLMQIFAEGKALSALELLQALVDKGHQQLAPELEQLAPEGVEAEAPVSELIDELLAPLEPPDQRSLRQKFLYLQRAWLNFLAEMQVSLPPPADLRRAHLRTFLSAMPSEHHVISRTLLEGGSGSVLQLLLERSTRFGRSANAREDFFWALAAELATPQSQTLPESQALRLNSKVSKMLTPLKKALVEAFQAVQQPLDCQWIFETVGLSNLLPSSQGAMGSGKAPQLHQQRYRLHPQVQVRQLETPRQLETVNPPEADMPLAAVSPEPPPLLILLLEDDPVYRQEISEQLQRLQLLSERPFVVHTADSLQAFAQLEMQEPGLLYALILLDLQVPRYPGQALQPEALQGGYQVLRQLRQRFQQQAPQHSYRVLVSSQFSDRDDLRRLGVELGIPVRNFVAKGRAWQQLSWPELLQLRLGRVLQELRWQSQLPDSQQLQLDSLPLHLRVLYAGPDLLRLEVQAQTLHGLQVQQAEHRGQRAAALRALLQHYPERMPRLVWRELLNDQTAKGDHCDNMRNRLRKEINQRWPVAWLNSLGANHPGKLILSQESDTQTWLWLNLRSLSDPEGFLHEV